MSVAQLTQDSKSRGASFRDTRSKKEIAYDVLKQRILSNQYTPGTPIIEPDVSAELKVSKTPIREALQQLERDGFVETVPGRGSFVSHITVKDIKQIFDAREVLECGAVRRVALVGDKDLIKMKKHELEKYVADEMRDSPTAVDRERDDVHLFIFKLLDNPMLSSVYGQLLDQIIRLRNYFNVSLDKERSAFYNREHLRILEALLEGSPDKAEEATLTHLRNASKYLIQLSSL